MINFESFVVGLYRCNCYLLYNEEEAIIIDPGDEGEILFSYLQSKNVTLKYIVLTHAHLDHIMAVNFLKKKTGAKIVMHQEDQFLAENILLQSQFLQLNCKDTTKLAIDIYSKQDTEIKISGIDLLCLHTPGHTPGSCCYQLVNSSERKIYSGDTLFKNSIGRTDLWKGNHEELIHSIHEKILPQENKTLVFPGHGETTSVEIEKEYNPFLQ